MINALANVNEISHVLGYKNFLQKKKKSFKVVAKDKFDSGASLQTWLKKWKARSAEAEEEDIGIKAEQGEIGAAAIHGWLQTGIAGNRQLAEWENHVPDAFFKKRPIKIDKVAWTPCGQSFTDFIKNCTKCKGCPATFRGTLHANNPSDALLMVTNKANEKTIIGVSLKATFKNADLTIYNGGVCGFLYLIVDKQDLENKELFCPRGGKPVGDYAVRVPQVIAPYTDFCTGLVNEKGYPAAEATSAVKQKWWKEKVQPAKNKVLKPGLIKKKLNSFGGVRDNLFNEIEKKWGNVQAKKERELIISMLPLQLQFILAGILQFTHSDVAEGGCKVPYVKLTAFGNMRIDIKPPAIEKYLEEAEVWEGSGEPLVALGDGGGGGGDPYDDDSELVSIKIVKRAADSLMLCIYKLGKFIPYFLIRVKCASRPPGSLKIDIKPIRTRVCVQTGGARRVLPEDFERLIQQAENDVPELDVMLQNLLEDTFPDCEPEIKTRTRRDCTGEVLKETIDTDNVVLEEIAACREEASTPLTDGAVKHALEEALKNKLQIIDSHIPIHNYNTRQWLKPDFWRKQKQILYALDKFLFDPPVLSDCCRRNPWAAAGLRTRRACNCVISGGSRKRRTKHRKRKYKKRKRNTRRKKY